MKDFLGCGYIICLCLQAVFGQKEICGGKSFLQKKEAK